MESPQVLTRSQKKQQSDTESLTTNSKLRSNSVKGDTVDGITKNKEIVESPLKRLQPSRLTKNTSTCKKTENASKNKTPSKDTNNETLPSTPRRISLWKPCNSPNHRQLSTIDENGKENILVKKEDSECSPVVKRTRRRSVSASNTNDVNIEPRITRRSSRSQSESILCVQSPLPEIKELPKAEYLQFNNVVNKQIDAIATSPNIAKKDTNYFSGRKCEVKGHLNLLGSTLTNDEGKENIQKDKSSESFLIKTKEKSDNMEINEEEETTTNTHIANDENDREEEINPPIVSNKSIPTGEVYSDKEKSLVINMSDEITRQLNPTGTLIIKELGIKHGKNKTDKIYETHVASNEQKSIPDDSKKSSTLSEKSKIQAILGDQKDINDDCFKSIKESDCFNQENIVSKRDRIECVQNINTDDEDINKNKECCDILRVEINSNKTKNTDDTNFKSTENILIKYETSVKDSKIDNFIESNKKIISKNDGIENQNLVEKYNKSLTDELNSNKNICDTNFELTDKRTYDLSLKYKTSAVKTFSEYSINERLKPKLTPLKGEEGNIIVNDNGDANHAVNDNVDGNHIVKDNDENNHVVNDNDVNKIKVNDNDDANHAVNDNDVDTIIVNDNDETNHVVNDKNVDDIIVNDYDDANHAVNDNDVDTIIVNDNDETNLVVNDNDANDIIVNDYDDANHAVNDNNVDTIIVNDNDETNHVVNDNDVDDIIVNDYDDANHAVNDNEVDTIIVNDNDVNHIVNDNDETNHVVNDSDVDDILVNDDDDDDANHAVNDKDIGNIVVNDNDGISKYHIEDKSKIQATPLKYDDKGNYDVEDILEESLIMKDTSIICNGNFDKNIKILEVKDIDPTTEQKISSDCDNNISLRSSKKEVNSVLSPLAADKLEVGVENDINKSPQTQDILIASKSNSEKNIKSVGEIYFDSTEKEITIDSCVKISTKSPTNKKNKVEYLTNGDVNESSKALEISIVSKNNCETIIEPGKINIDPFIENKSLIDSCVVISPKSPTKMESKSMLTALESKYEVEKNHDERLSSQDVLIRSEIFDDSDTDQTEFNNIPSKKQTTLVESTAKISSLSSTKQELDKLPEAQDICIISKRSSDLIIESGESNVNSTDSNDEISFTTSDNEEFVPMTTYVNYDNIDKIENKKLEINHSNLPNKPSISVGFTDSCDYGSESTKTTYIHISREPEMVFGEEKMMLQDLSGCNNEAVVKIPNKMVKSSQICVSEQQNITSNLKIYKTPKAVKNVKTFPSSSLSKKSEPTKSYSTENKCNKYFADKLIEQDIATIELSSSSDSESDYVQIIEDQDLIGSLEGNTNKTKPIKQRNVKMLTLKQLPNPSVRTERVESDKRSVKRSFTIEESKLNPFPKSKKFKSNFMIYNKDTPTSKYTNESIKIGEKKNIFKVSNIDHKKIVSFKEQHPIDKEIYCAKNKIIVSNNKICQNKFLKDNNKNKQKFKQNVEHIDLTEVVPLLTSKNKFVQSLKLNKNDFKKIKDKIVTNTEHKPFTYSVSINKPKGTKTKNQKTALLKNIHSTITNNIDLTKQELSKSFLKNLIGTDLNNKMQTIKEVPKRKRRNTQKDKIGINVQSTEEMSKYNNKIERNANNQKIAKKDSTIKDNISIQKNKITTSSHIHNYKMELDNKQMSRREKNKQNEKIGKVTANIPKVLEVCDFSNHIQKNENRLLKPKPTKFNLKNDKLLVKYSTANKSGIVNVQEIVHNKLPSLNLKEREKTMHNSSLFKVTNCKDRKSFQKKRIESSLFQVEVSSKSQNSKSQEKNKLKVKKDLPGFTVLKTTDGDGLNSDKTILKRSEHLENFRNSKEYKAGLAQVKQSVDNIFEGNMFKSFSAKYRNGKKKESKEDKTKQEKSGVKRLSSDLLGALENNPVKKKNKFVETIKSDVISNKKLKLKSAILDEGLIPLSTSCATKFAVARLDKEQPFTLAQQASNFRNNNLYGSHIRRISAKQLYNQKQKYKANSNI